MSSPALLQVIFSASPTSLFDERLILTVELALVFEFDEYDPTVVLPNLLSILLPTPTTSLPLELFFKLLASPIKEFLEISKLTVDEAFISDPS